MKAKSLAIGAGVAAILGVLAIASRNFGGPAAAGAEAGKQLFPGLLDKINDVASISVKTADGEYRIERQGNVWGLAEKGGYPVDTGQVRKTLIGIGKLETLEPKTADPTRYEKLGVEDPEQAGAASKLVNLRDSSGQQLAALIVGEARPGRGFSALYVRKAGEPQSWLVRGDLTVGEDGTTWLDKRILEVKRDEVHAVETAHPDGDVVFVSKDDREETTFTVRDVPEGQELRYASVGNPLGSGLEYLDLQDVLPASEFEAPEEEPVRARFWTWDGMRVDVEVHTKGEQHFATFRASHDPEGPPIASVMGPAPPAGEGGEEPPAEEGAEPGEAEPGEAEPAEEGRSPAEVQAEAAKLNARLEPWVFELSTYNTNNFTKHMSDMVKEPEPEPEPEPEEPETFVELPGGPPPAGTEEGATEPPSEDAPPADDGAAPGVEEPVSDETTGTQDPATEDPAAEDAPADDPPADEPPADEPPPDEPPADEPVPDEPAPDEPAPDEPAPEEPAPSGGGVR